MIPASAVPIDSASTRTGSGRLAWVDTLRGLCITLVVLHHMPGEWEGKSYLALFRMPLFFALTGFLFRTADPVLFTRKRVATILVPYFTFAFAVLLIDPLLSLISSAPNAFQGEPVWKTAARVLIGGWALFGPTRALWFLPVLFASLVLYNVLYRWAGGSSGQKMIFAVLGLGIVHSAIHLLISGHGPLQPFLTKVPHSALIVPAATIFVWVGNVVKERELYRSRAFILFVALLGVALSFVAEPVDMKVVAFGNPLIAVPTAVGLGTVAGLVAALIGRIVPALASCFALVGRTSLSVLCLHGLFIWHLSDYLPFLPLLAVAVAAPVGIHLVLSRWRWSRILFLGVPEPRDVRVKSREPGIA